MKKIKIYSASFVLALGISVTAQDAGKVLHQAMEQEIARNMKNLHLAGMKDPFYIGLNVIDFNMFAINSSLGSLIRLSETPMRSMYNNQVLVGDYTSNNLNYNDPRTGSYFLRTYGSLPVENSVTEIQRRLWLSFDRAYKLSAETYESKQSALKSRAQTDDIAGLPDYLKGEKVVVEKPGIPMKFNNDELVKYANEISLSLKAFKFLTNSWVRVVGYKGNVYFSNSEGSKATYPASLMRVVVNVETQAPNGELLELYRMYHSLNEADLPSKALIIKEAQELAGTLEELRNAVMFSDVYTGPVLFEDQAAAEAIRKTMFFARNENLFAARKPISGGPAGSAAVTGTVAPQNRISTEDRIDKRIANEAFNVKARPGLTEFEGIKLVGSYPVDMDGTLPQDVVLVENGILKNLLCGRTPTARMKASNGHLRVPLTMPNPLIVPGVIEVDFTNGPTKADLKKKLIELAQADGLDYALIVREMTPNQSELRRVYKVDVKTGKEQMIRSAAFGGLTLNDLRKIVNATSKKEVLNTTAGEDLQHKFDYLGGCPATFITPEAILFKDIDVNKSNKPVLNKPPVVKNPMEI